MATRICEVSKRAIVSLATLAALGSPASADVVHFSVSGGGASHLPILGKFVDIQVIDGSGTFDTESGQFEMVVTKRATSWLIGSAELTTHHVITPDHFTGRNLYLGPDGAVRAMLACEPIERFDCSRIPLPFGEFIQWESLFGSAKGVRLTFLGNKADFRGSGLDMPLTIANGSVLRIVWTGPAADEYIDYRLMGGSEESVRRGQPSNKAMKSDVE